MKATERKRPTGEPSTHMETSMPEKGHTISSGLGYVQ